jgi:hypothetical protein
MPLIKRKQHTVRGLNNRVVRDTFGPMRNEVRGDAR